MDKLPEPLFLEILSQFDDLADVSRCQIASKTFKTAYPHLRSINHQCMLKRYLNSRPSTVSSSSKVITPFKTVFMNMISRLKVVETVRIGIDNALLDLSYRDGEDEADDPHLTDGEFVKLWLPRVSGGMKSLSISDFWLQSCRRRSVVLSLVSSYCHNLVELEVKNAWLSVENVSPVPMLTSLTLESVRLDDKRLVRLNECFPDLKVLNLINVSGVKAPYIHLLNLKTYHWTVPDSLSSLTLITPNLSTLRLECIKSTRLHVKAPKLFHIHLDIDRHNFEIKKFENLKTVWLKSRNIGTLFETFELVETVENLTVDTRDWPRGATGSCNFTI
ncbi:F-box/LRR-repeat protein-like protein [Tanacetum coccineum]